MDESTVERVLRTPALLSAFAAEYDGLHDPRDAVLWLAHPERRGPTGRTSPEAGVRAMRTSLYRRGVDEADRIRFREQVERADRDGLAARAALDRVLAARSAAVEGRRRASLRTAAVAVALAAAVAAAAGALTGGGPPAPTTGPTASAAPTGLALRQVPAGWELSSLVRRDDAMTTGSTLTINRSVTGGEFLLLIRCPIEGRRFLVVLTEEGVEVGGPWSGACGRQAAVPLALERGVGRVEVVVTTRGDLPFAAAVVRRGSTGR